MISVFNSCLYGESFYKSELQKQGLTAGVGLSVETIATSFGLGALVHTGELLPFLVYFSSNVLANPSGYSLLTLDLGIGFRILEFPNITSSLLFGGRCSISDKALMGFSGGILLDIPLGQTGIYIFSQIGIVITDIIIITFVPLQINQVGFRCSF